MINYLTNLILPWNKSGSMMAQELGAQLQSHTLRFVSGSDIYYDIGQVI